jgi:hypothetical protein
MRLAVIALTLVAAACTPVPPTPEQAAQMCEERARAAQGPTGNVTIGASSSDGPFVGAAIGITGDFLAGRDPLEVYSECVFNKTGAAPIRAPVLR